MGDMSVEPGVEPGCKKVDVWPWIEEANAPNICWMEMPFCWGWLFWLGHSIHNVVVDPRNVHRPNLYTKGVDQTEELY